MFIDKAERKENIKFLKEVLDVLNRMDTSVEKQDGKYIVKQQNDKKYEITINPEDTVIRAFNNGTPGTLRVVWKDGAKIKAKLWLLKFELQDRTEPKPFETFVNKIKALKSDIKTTNYVWTVVDMPESVVSVEHETPVMKKYAVKYNIKDKPAKITVEFDGSVVKFNNENKETVDDYTGYLAWKWKLVRRVLDNKIAKQAVKR